MNTHIVTKPLPGPNGVIPVGTEIDVTDFRKVDQLVAQRYLKPLQPAADQVLENQVIAIVLKHAQSGGALAGLFSSLLSKRGRRPGSKNKEKSPAQ